MRIWIGQRPSNLVCAPFKKYLVLQPWQQPIKIVFRFETVWCVREGNSIVSKGGNIPITHVHLPNTDKVLIGRDDPYQTGLDYNDDARAFRKALDQRARESAIETLNPN